MLLPQDISKRSSQSTGKRLLLLLPVLPNRATDECLPPSVSYQNNFGSHKSSVPKSDWFGWGRGQTHGGLDPQWPCWTNTTWRSGFALAAERHYAHRLKTNTPGWGRCPACSAWACGWKNPHLTLRDMGKREREWEGERQRWRPWDTLGQRCQLSPSTETELTAEWINSGSFPYITVTEQVEEENGDYLGSSSQIYCCY